jgi:hypothetical protein
MRRLKNADSCSMGTEGSFRRIKAAGEWIWPLPLLSAKVKDA